MRNFGIWDPTTDVLMGNVEVRLIDERRVNLSYLVFPNFQHRGIATRATRLVLDYAATHLGATAVTIKMLTTNVASVGVAHALGAREAGQEHNEAGWTFLVFDLTL